MKAFTELYSQLDQTTKTSTKVEVMKNYFNKVDAASASWAIALLTGKRPKRPIKSGDVRAWALELSGIPGWLFEECYAVAGDQAETVSLLIPKGKGGNDEPLSHLMDELASIGKESDDKKKNWLLGKWQESSREEIFILNKLISGSFRVGVSQQLVYKALAKAYELDERDVAHRLMGNWVPGPELLDQKLLNQTGQDHSRPYPFYLAYQLDVNLEELGTPAEWQVERKFDGIRGQLVARNGELHVWSRGEELMTEKFVEFDALKTVLPPGTVIDGEVLPIKDGRILSFNEMQKRIGRKNLSKKMLQDVPLCLMCYDLLEHLGEDMRAEKLVDRRTKLESLVRKINSPLLQLSPLLDFKNWEELEALRQESKNMGCEGLMLKRRESVYETGRRRGSWWKWKVDPYTVDAVLIYAQPGHGRRANLYTDYTFAIWDNGELVPFTKAYSGLTDKEIVEVDNWIKKNTLEKFGPVRSVKAELVFEIAFEGIQASTRHKSGIALRFPRISRWRQDKKKEEINTKADLLQLINSLP